MPVARVALGAVLAARSRSRYKFYPGFRPRNFDRDNKMDEIKMQAAKDIVSGGPSFVENMEPEDIHRMLKFLLDEVDRYDFDLDCAKADAKNVRWLYNQQADLLDEAKTALRQISQWPQELQDRVVASDDGTAMWRGCVAIAKAALRQ
jgi:hypothetical protein